MARRCYFGREYPPLLLYPAKNPPQLQLPQYPLLLGAFIGVTI
jgi:hypothetical protein